MPIRTQSDLPAKEILERENIFVMEEGRASHQDIRPIQIAILNLMPLKEDTELQLLRSLSILRCKGGCDLCPVSSHEAKNTSTSHLNKFYVTFDEIKIHHYDGLSSPERRWSRWSLRKWITGRSWWRSWTGAKM